MEALALNEVFLLYKKNLKASLAFGILLVFVFLFALLPNTFLSTGTMFLDYSLKDLTPLTFVLELILIALYLMFYSIFVALIVFGVRKELSKVRLDYYLSEMLHKFAFKIFSFYALFALILALIGFAGIMLLTPLYPFTFLPVSLVLLLASLFFLFVPQAIVIDEVDVKQAIHNNFEFMAKHPEDFLKVLVFSIVFLALLPLLEFGFDFLYYSGRFVSLLITLIVFIPFVEVMKSRYYMLKFELVKSTQAVLKK